MKIQNLSISTNCNNFKGTPFRVPEVRIRDYSDAIRAWEYLKSAKYLDVHSDKVSYYNKMIRRDNYSFLDKLTSSFDKSMFVEKFCEFTRFPNLSAISDKMHQTFISTIQTISRNLNNNSYSSEYDILDAGYDPTCSLGLRKAFPGSDLDKGYVILKGSDYSDYTNENCVNKFQSELWDKLDQRLVSLNHPDTAVTVMTKKQVLDTLAKMERFVDKKEKAEEMSTLEAVAWLLGFVFAGPLVLTGLALNDKYELDHKTDPYVAGKFNRDLAKYIYSSSDREEAKNFAFFVETVDANYHKSGFPKTDGLFNRISNSKFVLGSNVTQIPAWQEKINEGYMKTKLRNRGYLESQFWQMSTDTKYDLVKEIVKYSSDDNSYRFSEYFKNDDDIALRYKKLLDALK